MHTLKKAAMAVTLGLACIAFGTVIADASDGGDPGSVTALPTGDSSRAVKDTGNGTTETKFVPVTPCRIVDTRLAGGMLQKDTSRSFDVTGTTGFTDQGGKATGCGIPGSATAVEVTVTSVDSEGGGFLRVYPTPTSEPNATFLNYSPDNPTNTGTIKLCVAGCAAGDLTARSHSNDTHIVMDVQGYYAKPLVAQINTNGTQGPSSRLLGVGHPGDGQYTLLFDRSVTGCVPIVSPYFTNFVGATQFENSNTIEVFMTRNDTGALTDGSFNIEVIC